MKSKIEQTYTVAENTFTRWAEYKGTVPSESGKGNDKVYDVYEVLVNPFNGEDAHEPVLIGSDVVECDLPDFYLASV